MTTIKKKRDEFTQRSVRIPVDSVILNGDMVLPYGAEGLVIFVHGSGSSRLSPRNRHVADTLNRHGIGTLLIDLLSEDEERVDQYTRHLRFDIPFLAERLEAINAWTQRNPETQDLALGYFGASTGAAAALIEASRHPRIKAVVSRGGRPDLASGRLEHVRAPVLLIVGSEDTEVLRLNRQALEELNSHSKIYIVPGATHLFEEPGTLDEAAHQAALWFDRYLEG